MEQIGVFLDEEWNSLSLLFTSEESQLNNRDFEMSADYWPIFERNTYMNFDECQFNSSDAFISEFHCLSQESGNNSSDFSSDIQSSESNKLVDPLVFSISESKRNSSLVTLFLDDDIADMFSENEEILIDVLGNDYGQLKRKLTMPSLMNSSQYMSNIESFSMTSKKKPPVSENTISKKNTKCTLSSDDNDLENPTSDDLNASGELSIGTVSKEGKKRKANGGATDSQSVYARKRREKINERLKTLQKLVPNGTKVDISTMLDEALHYVKFLQLQIKLLSSDDKWMYSPIAYNGMDIGLHSL